jgi:hypothetical protein
MLVKRKYHLETIIDKLEQEKAELEVHINSFTYTDEDFATLEAFALQKTKLPTTTFDDKRQILDLLDVRVTLAIENGGKIDNLQYLNALQLHPLALTSLLRNNPNEPLIEISVRLAVPTQ